FSLFLRPLCFLPLFFFCSNRGPPTSTLFPYTTLFRSIVDVEDLDAVAPAALAHGLEEGRAGGIGAVVAAGLGGDGVVLHREGEIDRKSTRLNSSHVENSYDVFCLKKKTMARQIISWPK